MGAEGINKEILTNGEGMWTIFGIPKDGEGDLVDLGFSYEKWATFYLPAGKLIVRRTSGERKAEQEVEIEVNKLRELSLEVK